MKSLNINCHKLPEISIFSAELWAILQAIQAIEDFDITKSIIFSDSESMLEVLCSLTRV